MDMPKCPKCGGEYVYEDGPFLICPECAYEWSAAEEAAKAGTPATESTEKEVTE